MISCIMRSDVSNLKYCQCMLIDDDDDDDDDIGAVTTASHLTIVAIIDIM